MSGRANAPAKGPRRPDLGGLLGRGTAPMPPPHLSRRMAKRRALVSGTGRLTALGEALPPAADAQDGTGRDADDARRDPTEDANLTGGLLGRKPERRRASFRTGLS
jgi:hypothetical protein